MINIREERASDIAAREALLDEAYGAVRLTKASERLREGRLPAKGLSLVALERGQIVGTIQLWHVTAGPGRPALLLGPLAVHPDHRNRGTGSALVCRALTRARLGGYQAVLLVGDAAYYGRFGFTAERTAGLWMPGRFEPAQLLALELRADALAGANGLVGATGPAAAAPTPSLNALIANLGRNDAPARRAA
jgi:predicted N-acetyltransferase YhbS